MTQVGSSQLVVLLSVSGIRAIAGIAVLDVGARQALRKTWATDNVTWTAIRSCVIGTLETV